MTIFPEPVGRITARLGRNWANIWKSLIDAFDPVLGEDPERPFYLNDDRITSLGLTRFRE